MARATYLTAPTTDLVGQRSICLRPEHAARPAVHEALLDIADRISDELDSRDEGEH
ncbi:hypothetical protein [Streptomyces angustmyceticus]|uniref:hypothetical protein n=1 Tax=Streptomyces angustmyceticus TaxID=285578 RepID=UPI00344F480F